MLKINFFNKNLKNNQTFSKNEYNFLMHFLNIYTGIAYFICTTYINFIHKVWVNLINRRLGFLPKKESPAQVFSCEFCEISKNSFLRNISVRTLLDRIQI